MNFKTISIVKFPLETTWKTMLHHLPDIAKDVEDLESITEMERKVLSPNLTKVVNLWKAKPNIPAMVMKYIKTDMLEWDDIALWKNKEKIIEWEINSHYYYTELQCRGITSFEPAMGSKGCKITFSGTLEWKGKILSVSLGVLDSTISKVVEEVLAQMIPSNLRKITEALGKYIEKKQKVK